MERFTRWNYFYVVIIRLGSTPKFILNIAIMHIFVVHTYDVRIK